MSASKPSLSGAHKRRPYNKPTFTKLTPEEAIVVLKAKSIPVAEQAQQLMHALKLKLEDKSDKRGR